MRQRPDQTNVGPIERNAMEEHSRQPTMDDYTPKMRFQFPDGSILTLGTRCDEDDPLLYGVQIAYASGGTPEPEMNILLPPHSVDVMIPVLEDMANQARYIMGQKTVEYPPRPPVKKPKRKQPAENPGDSGPPPGAASTGPLG
jgi:hypothetical protein